MTNPMWSYITVKREGLPQLHIAFMPAMLVTPPTTNYNCSVGVVSMSSSSHTNVKYATPTLQLQLVAGEVTNLA